MCLGNEQQPTAAQLAWKAKRVWKSLTMRSEGGIAQLRASYELDFVYAAGVVKAKGLNDPERPDAGLYCFLRREDAEAEAKHWMTKSARHNETVVGVTIAGADILAVGEYFGDISVPPCVKVRRAVLSKTEHTRALCTLRAQQKEREA